MRIAILGTRGIPANYGGFETFAEELAPRLVRQGYDVTVYCRSHHVSKDKKEHLGVNLKVLGTIRHKYFDTVVHTFLSALSAATKRFDVVLICNAANSPFIPILTMTGTPVALNVDGLERKRKKWNWVGRLYYRICEQASVWFATVVITDARVIQEYYLERYGATSKMIAYGAEVKREIDPDTVGEFGLEPERYFLYLSRLEPENNAAMVIEAFKAVDTDLRLVIVGDAPYADEYKDLLKKKAADDPRIIFTGFIFGDRRKSLQQNAFAYIHATEVGGTHPALIEAMGYGNCVIAYDTVENVEVLGQAGLTFSNVSDLVNQMNTVVHDMNVVEHFRIKAQERALREYNWENVTVDYAQLFEEIMRSK